MVIVKKQLVSIEKRAVLSSSGLTSLRIAISVCEVIGPVVSIIP